MRLPPSPVPGRTPARTAVITGATGGIGLETARGLARLGWRLVITGRDDARAAAARATLLDDGAAEVVALTGDLALQETQDRLAERILDAAPVLDVLVHNAGALDGNRIVTADGLARMVAVNHVAPWRLTHRLLGALRAAEAPRVVILTSSGHRFGRFDGVRVEPRARFVGLASYGDSKLLNLLAMFGWARSDAARGITVLAADPGGAATGMTDAMRARDLPAAMRPFWPLLKRSFGRRDPAASRRAAARSSIAAATDPALAGQTATYIGPSGRPVAPSRKAASRAAQDAALRMTEALAPAPAALDPAPARAPGREAVA